MSEEKGEFIITTDRMDRSFEETEGVYPPIDGTDNQNLIGEVSYTEPREVLEQNRTIENVHDESRINKRKQKRRITSYLSNISKQVEKHGNQINKISLMIQSLQKQGRTKPAVRVEMDQMQIKSIKETKSQISQLQKQVARIHNDIQRLRTASITRTGTRTRTKFRKQAPSTIAAVKSRAKRSRLLKSTKIKKRRK
ncbi:MAG: hypothetical protein ACRD8Z_12250 [Nitrososphaeraceae archaeon]